MKHKYFEIENFKGIEKVRLDLDTHPQSEVYTLVGLNESGKTTILQALHELNLKSETLDPLDFHGYVVSDPHLLIPIGKRSNFNDRISIKAGYKLDDDDRAAIKEYLQKEIGFELTKPITDFSITHYYKFDNSRLTQDKATNEWDIKFIGKRTKRARKEVPLLGTEWQKALAFVRTLLPAILYFPNFLFDFPDRIYLEQPPSDPEVHHFYRRVLQDVLNAIGGDIDLDTHVLERAKDTSSFAKQALESVLLDMGSNITGVILKAWNQVFKRPFGTKEIQVRQDVDEKGAIYLQLRLREGNQLYTIGERSLGFRWFFAFLLLTQYRGFRREAAKNVLFLLDEPASNLHSSAQTQLLTSFGNFPVNCSIIYTTHSHHLINPTWLEGTYVVKNDGLDYDQEVDFYTARDTVVRLEKYRSFAGRHPDQTTYFQPILDVLDFSPSKLENIPDVVMVEGKNDFYTLKYLHEVVTGSSQPLNLMPGGGAGSLDDVIRLYIAWGRNFIVLLDGDREGTAQKKRYANLFGPLLDNRIFLLADVDQAWDKWGMEKIIESQDRDLLQGSVYPSNSIYKKDLFNRAVQELYLTKKKVQLSSTTLARVGLLLRFCTTKLKI